MVLALTNTTAHDNNHFEAAHSPHASTESYFRSVAATAIREPMCRWPAMVAGDHEKESNASVTIQEPCSAENLTRACPLTSLGPGRRLPASRRVGSL